MSKKNITSFKSVKLFLEKTAGKDAIPLLKIEERLRKPFNDELVANKMKLKVTSVRTILNRLHYRGIANYQKTRNKKTGWYSYTWKIDRKRVIELVIDEEIQALKRLEEDQQQSKDYSLFRCGECSEALPFEVAMEYNFKCPNCGKTMETVNGAEEERRTKKEANKIRREIKLLESLT